MMSFRRLGVWTAIRLVGALFGVTGCGADAASAKATDPTEEAAQGLTIDKAAADTRADHPDGPRGHGSGATATRCCSAASSTTSARTRTATPIAPVR